MLLSTLRTLLSSLFGRDATDDEDPSTDEAREDEAVSYAEQVEYGVDERELSDEDRVLRLLVKRGGRVEEETIVEETGWTETHLSEVIADMEDDNQVSAITVGRKRVVCRRGFEPKGYRSHLKE